MQIRWNEESILEIRRRGEQHEGGKKNNNHQRRESLLLLCNTSKTWGKKGTSSSSDLRETGPRFHRRCNNPAEHGGVNATDGRRARAQSKK